MKEHSWGNFILWLDTCEKTLDDSKRIEKVGEYRSYIGQYAEIYVPLLLVKAVMLQKKAFVK
ncbi:hypothetical protein J2Z83_002426 [Virgibacillus natechei]|uniref:Uncharacterized protein n=1 Tax=Virgibacillus natechei TaxID=1216297 RepID=A0ABS4IH82_9BACI|nr:hypothetical protein [Virgibacillus natechei]MBP1970308.1 hypothetical protein [Virgibacillus natechei]UZD13135.1 hypothetical protein OLD84_00725 [Virgibacillus natechei]